MTNISKEAIAKTLGQLAVFERTEQATEGSMINTMKNCSAYNYLRRNAPTMAQQVRELWEQNQELIGLMGDIETGLRDIDPEGGDVEMNKGIINLYLDVIKQAREKDRSKTNDDAR